MFEQLLGLAERKKKLLLEAFSAELQTIVGEEESCVASLETLETRRLEIFQQAGAAPETTLEQLLQSLPATDVIQQRTREIRSVSDSLREHRHKIQQTNEDNQRLLQQALELTQHSIQLFARIPREVTYQAPGHDRKQQPGIPSLIDRKV